MSSQLQQYINDMDDDEKLLISLGAEPLVLQEKASELFRRFMMGDELDNRYPPPNVIELVMKSMIGNNREVAVMPSMTLSYYFMDIGIEKNHNPKVVQRYIQEYTILNNVLTKYSKMRKNYFIAIISKQFIVDEDATESMEGHYCAFFINKKDKYVEIFDSMFDSSTGSHHTDFFYKVGLMIGKMFIEMSFDNVVYPKCFTPETSLQITGGFILESENMDWRAIQRPESQNHYCYMWSIWYLNMVLAHIPIEGIAEKIKNKTIKTSLVIIKTYIYCILHTDIVYPRWKKFIGSYENFFDTHFLQYWGESDKVVEQPIDLLRAYKINSQARYEQFLDTFYKNPSFEDYSYRQPIALQVEGQIVYTTKEDLIRLYAYYKQYHTFEVVNIPIPSSSTCIGASVM